MVPTRRQAATAILSIGLIPFTAAHAQPAAIPDPEIIETPAADEPPTSVKTGADANEHMMAPVMINGQGPFRFLIDTGANTSCISRDLATRLKLEAGPPKNVHTMVGARQRPSVVIDNLQVGDRSRSRVSTPMLPFAGLDGVLGVDWLKGQRIEMRFVEKVLHITSSRPDKPTAETFVVPARRRLGQLTIVDADLGGQRISAMIDSGAQNSICNAPLREMVAASARRGADSITRMSVGMETIAGERFTGEMMFLPFLRLGGLRLGNVPVVYADMHVFDIWGLEKQPAVVLGMDLLTQFKAVSLDFGRSQVRFDALEVINPARARTLG